MINDKLLLNNNKPNVEFLISDKNWNVNDLEKIVKCPVCGGGERTILHKDLIDNIFFTSFGKWTLWNCLKCRCSYLNPRPTRESIYKAYINYYTHNKTISTPSYNTLSLSRKLRRSLANGYINWRYSTKNIPSTKIGIPILLCLLPLKNSIDRKYRHMPRIPVVGGKLLDVGCGNCLFLKVAQSCGWDVVGVDPDEKAIIHGLNQGFIVKQGGIECFDGEESLFDVITINHVIEHVHDPIALLKACNRLLKPSGQLWLETPNIDSFGHDYYKNNWRGLEPPRHLVLFNLSSLKLALFEAGFTGLEIKQGINAQFYMTMASEAIKQGLSDGATVSLNWRHYWRMRKNKILEFFFPFRKEILTMIAYKKNN